MSPEGEVWLAARCAAEWKVAESSWRAYVSTGRAPKPLPGYDELRRRRWLPQAVRDYPRPGQGQRNDLTAQHVGEMLALAKGIAGDRHYDEWSKLSGRLFTGTPAAVRNLPPAARRWAKRQRRHAEALARIEELAAQVGDLGAAQLSLRMREQIAIAEAKASRPASPAETEENQS